MPRTLYVNDPRAAQRRVYFTLTLSSDGVSPATGEAGGQPALSINGAAPSTTNVGVLVAVDAAKGKYYSELAQAAVSGLEHADTGELIYDSANTVPEGVPLVFEALPWAHKGTATAGAVGSITLENANGISSSDDHYNDMVVWIYAGTGANQLREILDYVGSTRVATPRQNFATAPDATSRYIILPAPTAIDLATATVGTVSALGANAITAAATAADFGTEIGTAVWATTTRALTDKAGFSLSSAGVQAIWDALSSALTTVGSIGKRLVDYLTGDAYARLGAPAGASVSADMAAVKAQTAAIETDTQDLQSRLPAALVGGRIDANMGAISGDATAADNAELAFDGSGYNVGGGSIVAASVTGAVGSVTGNVGGNVVGSVGSVATGGISAGSIAPDAIGASELAADAVTEIAAGVRTNLATELARIDGTILSRASAAEVWAYVTRELTSTGGGGATPSEVRTQVDAALAAGIAMLAEAERAALADYFLNRNAQGGSNTGVLVRHKLAGVPNKIVINRTTSTSGTMVVYAEDGLTIIDTLTVTFVEATGAIASITP
jgi:hypothetical protein